MSDAELRAAADRLVEYGSDEDAPLGQRVWDGVYLARAFLAEHPADENERADFDWLVRQCERHVGTDDFDGEAWWERGELSFTCDTIHNDAGESEVVAADWRVGYEPLPWLLTPHTRGDFRRLCAALGITLQESPP